MTTALVASGMAGGGFAFAGFLPRGAGALGRCSSGSTRRASDGRLRVAAEAAGDAALLAERDPDGRWLSAAS